MFLVAFAAEGDAQRLRPLVIGSGFLRWRPAFGADGAGAVAADAHVARLLAQLTPAVSTSSVSAPFRNSVDPVAQAPRFLESRGALGRGVHCGVQVFAVMSAMQAPNAPRAPQPCLWRDRDAGLASCLHARAQLVGGGARGEWPRLQARDRSQRGRSAAGYGCQCANAALQAIPKGRRAIGIGECAELHAPVAPPFADCDAELEHRPDLSTLAGLLQSAAFSERCAPDGVSTGSTGAGGKPAVFDSRAAARSPRAPAPTGRRTNHGTGVRGQRRGAVTGLLSASSKARASASPRVRSGSGHHLIHSAPAPPTPPAMPLTPTPSSSLHRRAG